MAETAGLSQTEIATRLDISLPKVGNWFQGKNFPKRDAEPLANLFNVPVEFLLYGAVPVDGKETAVALPAPHHAPAAAVASRLRAEAHAELRGVLAAAGDDVSRLGWVVEQLRTQLTLATLHWEPEWQNVYNEWRRKHSARAALQGGESKSGPA